MKKILHSFVFLFAHTLAFASEPLVDSQWLAQRLDDESLLIVDLRPKNGFEYAHIKGSTQTDYALWRQTDAQGIESMLPTKQHLQQLLSQMGATQNQHIILVTRGDSADGLASATRVYWTLDQIGHDRKSILNGGIIAYANAGLPLERGASTVKPTQYKITRMKQDQITAAELHKNPQMNRIDVRSKAEYLGIYRGAPDERAGTIPGSQSLPYDWFTRNGSGQFAEKDNLQTLVNSLKLNSKQANVVFCHTGHRASLSWFVLHELLERGNTILYDASTREWAKRSDLPIQQHIAIKH